MARRGAKFKNLPIYQIYHCPESVLSLASCLTQWRLRELSQTAVTSVSRPDASPSQSVSWCAHLLSPRFCSGYRAREASPLLWQTGSFLTVIIYVYIYYVYYIYYTNIYIYIYYIPIYNIYIYICAQRLGFAPALQRRGSPFPFTFNWEDQQRY